MEELIRKAMQKDKDSFMELFDGMTEKLYKTARALLYSDEDVADALQETILSAWENIGGLRKPAFFRTWVTRILINKCRDQLRKKEILFQDGEFPEKAALEQGYECLEWSDLLYRMDEKYRLVLALYYVEGFSTSEIAEATGLTKSAVWTRLQRGREKLSELYR